MKSGLSWVDKNSILFGVKSMGDLILEKDGVSSYLLYDYCGSLDPIAVGKQSSK